MSSFLQERLSQVRQVLLTVPSPPFTRIFISSLNARIEYSEKWMLKQNGFLDREGGTQFFFISLFASRRPP